MAALTFCQANINMEKNLRVHNLLLIHLIRLCQKYKKKRNIFDSLTNIK